MQALMHHVGNVEHHRNPNKQSDICSVTVTQCIYILISSNIFIHKTLQ